MKFLFTALLSGLISGLSLFSFAADLPARINISYSMTASGLSADVNDTLEIKQANGVRNYAITSEARATGLLALIESCRLNANLILCRNRLNDIVVRSSNIGEV